MGCDGYVSRVIPGFKPYIEFTCYECLKKLDHDNLHLHKNCLTQDGEYRIFIKPVNCKFEAR